MSLARFAFSPRFPTNTFWRDVDELFHTAAPTSLTPAADVLETDKTVELHLDMPGVAPEAIDVKLEGNQLTITAERKDDKRAEEKGWIRRERSRGMFSRTFTLTDALDGTQPEATYRHGVLVVTVPKREAAQPRSLKVKVEA
ncbi:MAG: Hsp20/alpha crystallin family protein [Archangium sp.]|nr:Hsp20/alpha crystallin family protein [Archangium sp.]MDP3156357.1 Hsp20/alpha crystallin family protein [Archangium sp.]MDP3570401.1 Hsp20/alpha crystallin family protein [Archangium sp.]